ncbi:MAG: DNA mismatch repair endonuclease MutL [Ignavibacteriae bacterium]|nr:DNA mismatch repair endonuclease MutL [Ignavibacteria bacterium]MBI3363340.1 DNA mismatch repair endonuclease MutL [Ignavibacteriota bacterium]
MASTIKILSQTLADKIAAGEVVQRPASAVKELLENSIDAKATSMTVIITNAGKSSIQVIDNGIGMDREDAELAFARHATSKIATYEDLENIRTLGFRGEALASIAAVSHVELRTRQHTADIGTKVRIEGGILQEITEEAATPGTSISLRNLFYNTPGRRNFLKSNNTEFSHIFTVIQRIALSQAKLVITFISDDETILQIRSMDVHERLKEIFGEKLAQSVFSFDQRDDFLSVNGFLGKPDFLRKTRTEQYLFLNNRYIVSRSINHAVFKAYEHLLEKGSFPFFILFLTIDPHRVDVNVHPSKMEVKFEDESSIYRYVFTTVRKALAAHDLVPMVGLDSQTPMGDRLGLISTHHSETSIQRSIDWRELVRPPEQAAEISRLRSAVSRGDDVIMHAESDEISASTSHGAPGLSPDQTKSFVDYRFPLWQVHNKYIITPIESGVMVVDQHAAHERVLYERTIARFNETTTQSQQLLFPHTIEMMPGDAALVTQLLPLLEAMGFSLKFFGKTTVILDGIPMDVKPGKEKQILQEIIDLYKEDEHNVNLEPREKLAQSYSCKAAIKAGDPLNQAEMQGLLDQLFATTIPYVCPHGRPVIVKLSLAELDRRFGRTS